MSNVYVVGTAMTVFGRHLERSPDDLAGEALQGSVKDAGCAIGDLGTAFYAGMTNGPLQGQISIPGQVVFSKIGIEGIPVFNVENACASGSSAFNLALQSVKAGSCDVALALGATGLGQIFELVTQLRGEAGARQVQGARHAIQENGGGLVGIEEGAVAINILSR